MASKELLNISKATLSYFDFFISQLTRSAGFARPTPHISVQLGSAEFSDNRSVLNHTGVLSQLIGDAEKGAARLRLNFLKENFVAVYDLIQRVQGRSRLVDQLAIGKSVGSLHYRAVSVIITENKCSGQRF